MLLQYKKIHESVADRIENWRTIDKNELVRSYEKYETNPYLKEGYVAAIMCRYWGAIKKYYAKSHASNVTKEDCYEWLSHAILYALEHKSWNKKYSSKRKLVVNTLDENGNPITVAKWDQSGKINNNIYLDPKGPDKCINMCIASTRQIFYQAANNKNRSINYEKHKRIHDVFTEDPDDVALQDSFSDPENSRINSMCYNLVSSLIKKNRYIDALVIDGVINTDTFISKKSEDGKYKQVFSAVKLSKHLRSLDERYCDIFSSLYTVDRLKLNQAKDILINESPVKISKLIKNIFKGISSYIREIESDHCIV